jgi:hypothetical protein
MLRQVDFGWKLSRFRKANKHLFLANDWLTKFNCRGHLFLLEAPQPFAMSYSPSNDPFLDQIAIFLKQRGLNAVALTLLEVGQPLTFIGGQLLWLAQPAVALLWPTDRVRRLAQLMEDPAMVQSLMQRLAADEASL